MAGRTDLYVGTIRGLLVCRRGDGGDTWHPIRRTLEARPVAQIVPGLTGPRHLIALVRGEGVFQSTDGGQEWRLRLPAVVACLLDVPQAPGRVYAGLAARAVQTGTAQLGEVMVSHDGGAIWSAVGALPGTPADVSVLTLAVTTLPPDPPVLWAGLSSGGVVASYDGGATWQWRRSGLGLRAPITRLAPLRARRPGLYAAGGAGIAYLDLRQATAGPAGATAVWRRCYPQLHADSELLGPGTPVHLLALGRASTSVRILASDSRGLLWSSDDGAVTWALLNTEETGLPPHEFVTALAANPFSTDQVFLGTAGGSVYASADRGTTWTRLTFTTGGAVLAVAVGRQ
jgi:photosystem II stability/assembly factor-like uncharacterized protein